MSGNVPSSPVPAFIVGKGLQEGGDLQKMANQLYDTEANITAQADGTKANATRLNAVHNHIGTVAGAADSLLLPPGYVGLEITIANFGGAAAQVFGSGSDTIDGIATATGVSQADNTVASYRCYKQDPTTGIANWFSLQGA
jgi:hypothetical protein